MSKISKIVEGTKKINREKPVVNFMGGISYELNPIDTLKMISASSIFGEPAYYRDGIKDGSAYINKFVLPYRLFELEPQVSTSDIMIDTINRALDYDFEETIKWAVSLRNDFYMRLNPQVIMTLASIHPARVEFNRKHPGMFRELNLKVMRRADEPASQLAFFLYHTGDKTALPSVLKRSWNDRISSMTRYEMAKYKNAEVSLIDTIRISHAKGELVDELMKTGKIEVEDNEKTWENLRSEGKTWKEIVSTIKMGHMACLRNLRNIFTEIDDADFAKEFLENLKAGVIGGKQFPFRYYTAYKMIEASDVNHKGLILDTLEECIDISIANMPKLKGKTICLSDNSGSAWGTITSEYGTTKIAEIDNLSSVITGMLSEEGEVGKFGDRLEKYTVSKRNGALKQAREINKDMGRGVGLGTENGIWLFFEEAINKKIHYDNIFIYSDMQAGHGGLYGTDAHYLIGEESFVVSNDTFSRYIDVMKLINKYRSTVNPKVNVFCIQTAGYNNILIPEYTYRGAVLYGWTGKEVSFASEIIKQWEDIENRDNKKD